MRSIGHFLGALAVVAPPALGRWSEGTLETDDPLMILYVDDTAGWTRGFHISDVEKFVLSRNLPVRNWVLNYSFLTWNPVECRIVPIDTEMEFGKADPGMYPNATDWWYPGDSSWSSGAIPAFLALKQKYPYIKLFASIGGWSRSHTYHECLKHNQAVMVQSLVDVVNSFGFDGVDFDWEYPNCDPRNTNCGCRGEASCLETPNVAGDGDWERFLEFSHRVRLRFNDLENKLEKRLYLTAALSAEREAIEGEDKLYSAPTPFKTICDQTTFDWINLLTYDFYGPWRLKTGPLSPLHDTPDEYAKEGDSQRSIEDSLKRILKKCATPEKLVIGLPAYGRLWKGVPRGEGPIAGLWELSRYEEPSGFGLWESGITPFWSIKTFFETSSSCVKSFDVYSKTAALFCEKNPLLTTEENVFVSYDDGRAWREKMAFAREHGFAGGIVWAASDMGNRSPDHSAELLTGAMSGWFGQMMVVEPPSSNNFTEFLPIPVPWENFPCPIPYGTNQASSNPIDNYCYQPTVDIFVYAERDPIPIPISRSVLDNVGKDQILIHPISAPNFNTTTLTQTVTSRMTRTSAAFTVSHNQQFPKTSSNENK